MHTAVYSPVSQKRILPTSRRLKIKPVDLVILTSSFRIPNHDKVLHNCSPVDNPLNLLFVAPTRYIQKIAFMRWTRVDFILPPPSITRPRSGVLVSMRSLVLPKVNLSSRNVTACKGTHEDLVGGFGLIGWNQMSGLEDPREGEVAILSGQTCFDIGRCDEGGVSCFGEVLLVAPRDVE